LAVVLLGEGEAKNLDRVEVAFSGGGLLPATIAVRSGTTLLVRNDDEFAHQLYADGLEGFSAEAISPRGRRSISISRPGSWPLHDKVISHVTGQLHALPDLIAVGTVDADGQYTFKDVQPGKYVLKVLHGDKELAVQQVEVGSRPLSVNPIALTQTPAAK